MSWSAKQYVAFEDERTRPVCDLLSALPDIEAQSAMDRGCGPGNSTEVLAAVALAYPVMADGSVLLPFPRLFMTAIR